jgi:hypothetical protein
MMKPERLELKDLYVILIPLLVWSSVGWFLYPTLAAHADIPSDDGLSGGSPYLSYIVGAICLIIAVILFIYVTSRQRQRNIY